MASILSIKSVQSVQVEIKDENGAPTGVFFELAGPTHPKRKQIALANQRRLQNQLQKTGKVQLDDPVEQESQAKENLAEFTLGWNGLTDDGGAELQFSKARALELYENDDYAWLVDQLTTALNEKERFMQRSAKG
jgi:hypothetical protein